jgi:homocysteine S-methyltransferase
LKNNKFRNLLAAGKPVVIDGGLATQLQAQGHDINNPLWSASLVRDNPQAIVDAHRAYLDAGAQVIISASYQATAPDLVAKATELALRARDEFVADYPQRPVPLVAASVGPYGATLCDGSEYTGIYDRNRAGLAEFHRPRLQQLDASHADMLACETVPAVDEAAALCDLLSTVATPAWVSFCCKNGAQLSDGTPVEEAARLFRNHPNVQALGVNCTGPQYMLPLIERIRKTLPEMPIIVYPNSGETFDGTNKTWSGTATADDWVPAATQWLAAGATIIGGCCRTGPEHIHALRQMQS